MRFFIVVITIALAGCTNEGKEKHQTDNSNFSVALLFTYDGCKVYRFYDGMHPRYFVKCNCGGRTAFVENCGKNCTRRQEIQTIVGRHE